MPYHLSEDGKTVMGPGGKPVPGGKHGSKKSALRHLRALEINVKKGDVVAETLQKGDVVGHDFHGNQWTGASGGSDKEEKAVWKQVLDQTSKRVTEKRAHDAILGTLEGYSRTNGFYVSEKGYWHELNDPSSHSVIAEKGERQGGGNVFDHLIRVSPQAGEVGIELNADRLTSAQQNAFGNLMHFVYKNELDMSVENHGETDIRDLSKGDVPGHEFHGNQWTDQDSARYVELINKDRLTAAELKKGDAMQKGDVVGHEFHGNQWTGAGVPSGLPEKGKWSAATEKLAAQHAERMSKFEVDKEGNLTRKTGALVTTIAPSPYNKNLLEISHYRELGDKSESLNVGPQKTYATQYEAARIASIEHEQIGARLERQAPPKDYFFNAPEKYPVKKGAAVTNYSMIFSELMKGDMPEGTRVYLREADGKFAKGDVPGHEFHGNQYSEGGGSGGGNQSTGSGSGFKNHQFTQTSEGHLVAGNKSYHARIVPTRSDPTTGKHDRFTLKMSAYDKNGVPKERASLEYGNFEDAKHNADIFLNTGRAELATAPVLKGDVPGHEFHGNQWTEGGGGGSTITPVERVAPEQDARTQGVLDRAAERSPVGSKVAITTMLGQKLVGTVKGYETTPYGGVNVITEHGAHDSTTAEPAKPGETTTQPDPRVVLVGHDRALAEQQRIAANKSVGGSKIGVGIQAHHTGREAGFKAAREIVRSSKTPEEAHSRLQEAANAKEAALAAGRNQTSYLGERRAEGHIDALYDAIKMMNQG